MPHGCSTRSRISPGESAGRSKSSSSTMRTRTLSRARPALKTFCGGASSGLQVAAQ
ncbi:Uncharacterised protein [Bordetella pertussis]|nr:Uncharacterised protein [Bordetella pertussis]